MTLARASDAWVSPPSPIRSRLACLGEPRRVRQNASSACLTKGECGYGKVSAVGSAEAEGAVDLGELGRDRLAVQVGDADPFQGGGLLLGAHMAHQHPGLD